MSWTEKTRGLRTCHRLLLDLTSGEIQAHREGEAPAEPQERKTLSKKAQQELRPPEGLATKQFFCNAGVNLRPSGFLWLSLLDRLDFLSGFLVRPSAFPATAR